MVKPNKRQKALSALIKGKGKKGRTKATKAAAKKVADKIISKIAAQKGPGKGFRGGGVISATRAPLPRLLRMNTHAGLNMHGGVISGVTEIVPDLTLSAAENVAGTVLYQTPIHPAIIAPGSRFADIAAMYDQYVFEELQITLGSDIPFNLNGMIAGGLERDPADPLPAKDGIIDVKKYMEHERFHAESMANKRGVRFPQSKTAIRKSGKGPTSGFFFNRMPATASDLTNLIQGQLVIFVHTKLSSDGAFALEDPLSLGPLTLRWKVRMKEAAEKNQLIGNADLHHSTGGTVSNPFNWTANYTLQTSLQPWSTLQFATACPSNNQIWAQLPEGSYLAVLHIHYNATGASDFAWEPQITAQTDMKLVQYTSSPLSKLSAGGIDATCYLSFTIEGFGDNSGTFELFTITGTSTGWTYSSADMYIVAMSAGMNSLLTHPDHGVRSFAWTKLRDGHDRRQAVKREVQDALKSYGIEKKDKDKKDDSKYDRLIQHAHLSYLKSKERAPLKPPRLLRQRALEEKKRPSTPEDDLDDYEDFEAFRFGLRKEPLRILQDDEKSDRLKPAQKRASSLKS